jgi:hypothetical protein
MKKTNLTEVAHINMTKNMKNDLNKLAENKGLNKSEFLRFLIVEKHNDLFGEQKYD